MARDTHDGAPRELSAALKLTHKPSMAEAVVIHAREQ